MVFKFRPYRLPPQHTLDMLIGKLSEVSGPSVGCIYESITYTLQNVIMFVIPALSYRRLFITYPKQGRDEVFLCALSNFDAYFITRVHKTPRPFAFAVKSTDKLSFFENTADYLHVFSCGEKEGNVWMEKILVARVSDIIVYCAPVIFKSATSRMCCIKKSRSFSTRRQLMAMPQAALLVRPHGRCHHQLDHSNPLFLLPLLTTVRLYPLAGTTFSNLVHYYTNNFNSFLYFPPSFDVVTSNCNITVAIGPPQLCIPSSLDQGHVVDYFTYSFPRPHI